MKKIIFIFILLITISGNKVWAMDVTTGEILEEQKKNFGISNFLKEAEKYSGDFLEDIDIQEMLNSAITGNVDNNTIYKKVLNILGTEIKTSVTTLISILVIVIIHSILKSISDNLENGNVAKIIYYAQYIVIVSIILANFTDIILLIKETASNLVGFMNALIPILITLMTYTGSIITGGLVQPIILFMINFIGNMIQTILIPLVLVIAALSIASKISDKAQIGKVTKFFKSSIVWFLGIVLTIFVGVLSLEGSLSSSIDGITAKTAKAAVSSIIPVVGKILGDAVDSVLGCGVILKNALGVVGIIVIMGICIMPVVKLRSVNSNISFSSSYNRACFRRKNSKVNRRNGRNIQAVICNIMRTLGNANNRCYSSCENFK